MSSSTATTALPVCPYCGGVSTHLVSSTDRNRRLTEEIFHYFRCEGCALVFLDPVPENMGPYYEGGYQAIPASLQALRVLAKKEAFRMRPILRLKDTGRLLEVGPWIGLFSCNAKDAGFDVTAIEMNEDCVQFLRQAVGIEVIHSYDPAHAMESLDETYDVIALWHCLEHLPRPWQVLQAAAQKLAPGGILLISIPNIESYEFCTLKDRWYHLDAPRHLNLSPSSWLEAVTSKAGLQTLEVTTSDQLSKIVSRGSWHTYAASMIPIKYVRGLAGLFLYLLAKAKHHGPLSGGGLTAIFQKPS